MVTYIFQILLVLEQPSPAFLPRKSHGLGAWSATVHGVTESWTGATEQFCWVQIYF